MGELIKFEVKRLPSIKLVGKEIRYNMDLHMQGENRIPDFWNNVLLMKFLYPLKNRLTMCSTIIMLE